MTQIPCQVRILTPETGRFEPLRALPDQAKPGLPPGGTRPAQPVPDEDRPGRTA